MQYYKFFFWYISSPASYLSKTFQIRKRSLVNFTKFSQFSNQMPFIFLYHGCRKVTPMILQSKIFNRLSCCAHSNSSDFHPGVPYSLEEAKEILSHAPLSPPNSKLLKIAIIGPPNSGKSTLINQLIGWKLCSISKKVHTTQCNARAIHNEGETQLVFIDTPGILSSEEVIKYKPKSSMVLDPEVSLQQADLIAVVHDVSNKFTRNHLHPSILRLLALYPQIPSILIFNKIDVFRKKNRTILLPVTELVTDGVVSKKKLPVQEISEVPIHRNERKLREVLLNAALTKGPPSTTLGANAHPVPEEPRPKPLTSEKESSSLPKPPPSLDFNEDKDIKIEDVLEGRVALTERQVQNLISERKGWPGFNELFMVSALVGLGVQELKTFLLGLAKKAEWIFSGDILTDQNPQDMALMTVRSTCLNNLKFNLPYDLQFQLLDWRMTDSGMLVILVHILCPKNNIVQVVRGYGGKNVRKIAIEAEQELRDIFRTEVKLRIGVCLSPVIKGSHSTH